jgi:hypothetical protein
MKEKHCSLCGKYFEKETKDLMHGECWYKAHRAKLNAKYNAWKGDRRALYFANISAAYEATKKGKEVREV